MNSEHNDQLTLVIDARSLTVEGFDFLLFKELGQLIKRYPERFGPVFIITGSFYSALWLLIKPFLGERALQRIVEIPEDNILLLQKYIAADQIQKDFGGKSSYVYKAATFAQELDQKILPPQQQQQQQQPVTQQQQPDTQNQSLLQF